MNERIAGDELKVRVEFPIFKDITAADYEWQLTFGVFPNAPMCFKKSDCIALDDGSYALALDTSKLGVGMVTMGVSIDIPDGDYPDGKRTERDYTSLVRLVRKYKDTPVDGEVVTPRLNIKTSLVSVTYLSWEAYVDAEGRVYRTKNGLTYNVKKEYGRNL